MNCSLSAGQIITIRGPGKAMLPLSKCKVSLSEAAILALFYHQRYIANKGTRATVVLGT